MDLQRLCNRIISSRLNAEPFRRNRRKIAKYCAGASYGVNEIAERPINFLSLYRSVIGRNLLAKEPRVMLSTFTSEARTEVASMQNWVNKQIVKMCLAEVLREWVNDALVGPVGIIKVAIAAPQDAAASSWAVQSGMPFVKRVSVDDFVFDDHSKTMRYAPFQGHKVRVPLSSVTKDPRFKKHKDSIQASTDRPNNEQGDPKLQMLSRKVFNEEEVEDMTDLWEIFVPSENKVYTLASDEGGNPCLCNYGRGKGDPLLVSNWIGRHKGPFHYLYYDEVPDNPWPKGAMADLVPMDLALNAVTRQLIIQAKQQKDVLLCPLNADPAQVEAINQATTGQALRYDGQPPQPTSYGGPNNLIQAFAMQLDKLLNKYSGNIELLSGAAAQSPTATQDEMLNQNSSQGIADKQDLTTRGVCDVVESLCWYYKHHPTLQMKTMRSVPGMPEVQAPENVTPEQRHAFNWDDVEVKIDPYSIRHKTPQMRLQFLNSIMMQLQPYAPIMAQQGKIPNWDFLLSKMAEYGDEPDVVQLFTVVEPPEQGAAQQSDEMPTMPAQTNRTYTRLNRGEATKEGQDGAVQQALLKQDAGGSPSRNGTY